MNPYANFGPLVSYSYKPIKTNRAYHPIVPDDVLPPPGNNQHRNLVLCITRRSSSNFLTTVQKVVNSITIVKECILDVSIHSKTMVDEFVSYTYSTFSNSGEPANFAIAVEDPALLELAVNSGLITLMLRSSIVGRSIKLSDKPNVYVFLSNIAGIGNANAAVTTCESLQSSLRETIPHRNLNVILNSLLQPESGGFSTPLQDTLWHFFDRSKFAMNNFTLDEEEIAKSLRGKLAFVEDLRTMLTAHKLSLIMGDLGTLEMSYNTIQSKVLKGEVLTNPDALRDVVLMEQKIKDLLDVLGASDAIQNCTACTNS